MPASRRLPCHSCQSASSCQLGPSHGSSVICRQRLIAGLDNDELDEENNTRPSSPWSDNAQNA